jgi:hypothetical protein
VGTEEVLTAAIDRLIDYFNRRTMDLPDGLFDRKTQFAINGATFESLISATPSDPLVMMLTRGPAGYRFTVKALQHAVPDAKIARASIEGDEVRRMSLRLTGTLRGTAEPIDVIILTALRLTPAGQVDLVEATIDPGVLQRIREARLRP